jgi:exosortase E/protease (VPEID-CTERM system)
MWLRLLGVLRFHNVERVVRRPAKERAIDEADAACDRGELDGHMGLNSHENDHSWTIPPVSANGEMSPRPALFFWRDAGAKSMPTRASAIRMVVRGALLLGLVGAEAALYYRFADGAAILRRAASPSLQATLAITTLNLGYLLAISASLVIVSNWYALCDLLNSAAHDVAVRERRSRWLAVHLLSVSALIGWASISPDYVVTPAAAVTWAAGRLVLLAVGVLGLLFTYIPPDHWLSSYRRNKKGVLTAGGAGCAAGLAALLLRNVWWPSDTAALYGSYFILRLLGQNPTIDIGTHDLGVSGFIVTVAPKCAGIEGVSMIILAFCLYLWLYRSQLRFPQVLMLLPIGAVASWIANLIRIAGLIMLGVHYPNFAVNVFHSLAGWTYFILIGLGLVAASNHFAVFRAEHGPAASPLFLNDREVPGHFPIGAWLLPLLAVMGVSMLTRPLYQDFDWLYPTRVIAACCVLFAYRRQYLKFEWSISWEAIAIGAAVFGVWVILGRLFAPTNDAGFVRELHGVSHFHEGVWLVFRVFGAVATVPMAEELAFRGYLLRRLISFNVEPAAPVRFTWASFLISSVLFGASHQLWFAGALAGMAFAGALYYRGRVCDAIVAHATANALIAVLVLTTGAWWLWT